MVNYILADYKRILSRIPRIVFVVGYSLVFFFMVMNDWNKAVGAYNSVQLMNRSSIFFYSLGAITIGLVDVITSFSNDFKAKTMQVAIGRGVSRLQVLICKLIQIALVVLTDMLLLCAVLGVLCIITGNPLAPSQLFMVFMNVVNVLLNTACTTSLLLFLIYRLQNMLITMIAYLFVSMGSISGILRWITRVGPEFLLRLQLENYTFEKCLEGFRTHALMGAFHFGNFVGIWIFLALGVLLGWLAFRKMELDF